MSSIILAALILVGALVALVAYYKMRYTATQKKLDNAELVLASYEVRDRHARMVEQKLNSLDKKHKIDYENQRFRETQANRVRDDFNAGWLRRDSDQAGASEAIHANAASPDADNAG